MQILTNFLFWILLLVVLAATAIIYFLYKKIKKLAKDRGDDKRQIKIASGKALIVVNYTIDRDDPETKPITCLLATLNDFAQEIFKRCDASTTFSDLQALHDNQFALSANGAVRMLNEIGGYGITASSYIQEVSTTDSNKRSYPKNLTPEV